MQHRKRKHLEGKTKRTYYWVYCASIKYLVTTIFKLQLHLPKLLCTFKKVTENNLQNGERDLINQAIKYDNLYWEYRKSHTPKNIMTALNLTLQWTYYIKNCASCSFNYFCFLKYVYVVKQEQNIKKQLSYQGKVEFELCFEFARTWPI